MLRTLRLVSALGVILLTSQAVAEAQSDLPKILVLATGGTIAGEQPEPGTQGGYDIRKDVGEVVASVPEVWKYARVETEQFTNLPSTSLTPDHWLRLAKRINTLFHERADLAGIVVTHGTSRLEETAFFLHLTVRSSRPVVVVGAQRPATGISPDGPLNLLAAIRVAASPQARGKGALVVMDERILSARDTEKQYARNGGFDVGEMGVLGVVATHGVEFFYQPTRRHTAQSEFDVTTIKSLPRVDVHYSYVGADGGATNDDVKGVVVATTGFSPGERTFYERAQKQGIVVATTFPSGEQVVSPSSRDEPLMVAVHRLTPLHARILLMLALTKTSDYGQIQRIFNEY